MDEAEITRLHEQAHYDDATTSFLRAYGRELLGFLQARLRDDDEAREVYARCAVDIWRGMPAFERRSSFRTWGYTLTHHALGRYLMREKRPQRRGVPWSDEAAPALMELIRTTTQAYQRTDVKSRFAALRERLPSDDQTVLILRVDRGMGWRDVAGVLLGPLASPDDLERESVRLRQHFRQLKVRLRELALEAGLLE
jgi:RNA polymerase sigma-70 factor (ECF subfamily)